MLDLFTIFSKSGLVLWCFQGTSQSFTSSVNALIKSVILQERGGLESFTHEALTLKYKLDNEFELVFVVAYQKFLKLSYVDKFLSDIQIEFRNKYKDDLQLGNFSCDFSGFSNTYQRMLNKAEELARTKVLPSMRTYQESDKSKTKVRSLIERKDSEDLKKAGKKKNKAKKLEREEKEIKETTEIPLTDDQNGVINMNGASAVVSNGVADSLDEKTIQANIRKMQEKGHLAKGKKTSKPEEAKQSPGNSKRSVKVNRQWDLSGKSRDAEVLDYSRKEGESMESEVDLAYGESLRGQMVGELKDIETEDDDGSQEGDEELVPDSCPAGDVVKKGGNGFGFLSSLRSLVSSKTLTQTDVQPVLDKMREHLIAKNVASDIAEKLCESVATKLEGRVVGTFDTVTSTVRTALMESCTQILTPRRRVDILRDAVEAHHRGVPYVAVFCGVNGVGKSTNLAKICFWLIENGLRVLIAACDTFRAGAVEQLRTHCRKLNALHPQLPDGRQAVQLYEKGYGKDAAGIASEAISHSRDQKFDVVLVDTAGRMQDNVPLMRSLAKLIKVNQPDLVLFVGEALVGNEAVDQLVKFNQALADNSASDPNPHLIDGIVLTKFDTIDDKVGAAISMTYITGQPIVFVGTGQTYTDLKNLNAKAVVHALMK